jgi:chemotaxis-related protein WspD
MSDSSQTVPGDFRCWSLIGIWGNADCPRLAEMIHCRNCPEYSIQGQQLLDRDAPPGYVAEWTAILAEPKKTVSVDTVSVVVFRLADEWFALDVNVFQEIAASRVIRRLPHLTSTVLLGLVNIQGELLLTGSLDVLFGLAPRNRPSGDLNTQQLTRRFMVTSNNGKRWVFPVDEVFGLHRLLRSSLEDIPVTLSRSLAAYSQGLFELEDRRVALLDTDMVFNALQRSIR